jgi:AAA+ ATPase superfamily predicted ATPase
MFTGRMSESKQLEECYLGQTNGLVVLYGRRRIGKSLLLQHFCRDKKSFIFEGLEGVKTIDQISLFINELQTQAKDFHVPNTKYTTWIQVFDLLTIYLQTSNNKIVIVFDEFQWMAQQKTILVSLIKKYFDNQWAHHNIMLILCGSISTFMVGKVIHSKALYGRVNLELQICEFSPYEAKSYLIRQRGAVKLKEDEILKYLMILGGVPKYLSEIRTTGSFAKNIDRLCFQKSGFLFNEFEKIFYSQFREPRIYRTITEELSKKPLSLDEISKITKIRSGGGLKSYINNLILTGFVSENRVVSTNPNAKIVKYRIHDAFLNFYFKFMKTNRKILSNKNHSGYFQKNVETNYSAWLGLAFENFCIANSMQIANALGFEDELLNFGPLIYRDTPGVQVDLAFYRFKNILTICEIKYWNKPIGTEIISEVKKKIKLVQQKFPAKIRIEVVLISPFGITKDLDQVGFFNKILTIKDFFQQTS